MVQLYLTRPVEKDCNPGNFSIEVADSHGKLIFEKTFKEESPKKMIDGAGYKSQGLAFIKSEAYLPLTISILELSDKVENKYVFEVSKTE